MIKTIKKLALLFIALAGILSCNKWLEATSSTQVSDATLFSSRSGFQDALCGVYISMGEEAEYGAMWSWFVNELAYGPYAQQFSPLFTAIQNHEWDDNNVNSLISQMWKAGYYSIANINKVLYELDAKPDVVSDRIEWNLMKGELLALRAYIHFDLMRMFGLVQLSDADYEKYTVPYVTAYDKEPTPQRTYRETLALLEDDLNTAVSLLEDDPIRGKASEAWLINANADGFWDARNKRMNYFAAKALKARVLLFRYELDAAAALAQEVITEATAAGACQWVDADAMTKATKSIRFLENISISPLLTILVVLTAFLWVVDNVVCLVQGLELCLCLGVIGMQIGMKLLSTLQVCFLYILLWNCLVNS